MADIGEMQISEKDLGIKPAEKIDPWRDLKVGTIEGKALELAWAKSITGRRVDFPQPDGKLVWGVEFEIPLRFEGGVESVYTEQVKKFAEEKGIEITAEELQKGIEDNKRRTWFRDPVNAIQLPENIKKVRILDLSPQEALPKNDRNIDSKRDFYHAKYVTKTLTGQSQNSIVDRALLKFSMGIPSNYKRSEALGEMFYDIFWGDKKKGLELKETLEKSGGSEILFVHAHGGYNTIIGEQTTEVKGADAEFQTPGNRIDLTDVIKKYDEPEKYGAILVNTCYLGKELPPVERIPVYRVGGFSGGAHMEWNKTKTLISKPQSESSV